MGNISDIICREIKTRFMFNNIFRISSRLEDNVEKHGSARRVRIAC